MKKKASRKKTSEPTNRVLTPQNRPQAPFTHFSREEFVYEKDGKLYGRWVWNFSAACGTPPAEGWIEKDAVLEKTRAGDCSSTGAAVIKVVHN